MKWCAHNFKKTINAYNTSISVMREAESLLPGQEIPLPLWDP
jgi:hypothetical protein